MDFLNKRKVICNLTTKSPLESHHEVRSTLFEILCKITISYSNQRTALEIINLVRLLWAGPETDNFTMECSCAYSKEKD